MSSIFTSKPSTPKSAPSSRPSSVYSSPFTVGSSTAVTPSADSHVDVLLLGSGWTSAFLIPELYARGVSFAYTNRSGQKLDSLAVPQNPIKWSCLDAGAAPIAWRKSFKTLPTAKLVVVVLPLKDEVAAKELVREYEITVAEREHARVPVKWVILGSTSVWGPGIHSSESPTNAPTPRGAAEAAILHLAKERATVLNLAGLYGGSTRHPINWLEKVADSQEKFLAKTSLHLVHGRDVARAVLGVWDQVGESQGVWGKRWIVTDGQVYDWWKLAQDLPSSPQTKAQYAAWVLEAQKAFTIKRIPRSAADPSHPEQSTPEYLDRSLSSKSFWAAIGLGPSVGPAYEVDLPISPVSGARITTSEAAGASTGADKETESDDATHQSTSRPWKPSVTKSQLEDLSSCLKHEISREDKHPIPAIFEGQKRQFGLPQPEFHRLRKGWFDFLSNNESDGWSSHWKTIQSFDHYFFPCPEKLSSKYAPGTLDGIHFLRVEPSLATRSQRKVIPLLLPHGWPSAFNEYLFVARPLANPGPEVPLSKPAFDVIIPSMPGYCWSGSPVTFEDENGNISSPFTGPEGDILPKDVGDLLDALMVDLGFGEAAGNKYVIQAGDWGSGVARSIGVKHKDNVRSIHLNFIPAPPPQLKPALVPQSLFNLASSRLSILGNLQNLPRWIDRTRYVSGSGSGSGSGSSAPSEGAAGGGGHETQSSHLTRLLGLPKPLSESDAAKVSRGIWFETDGRAYAEFHATRPSTLGAVMHNSPGALLAWVGDKLQEWCDPHRQMRDEDIYELLTLWWVTYTAPRSWYPYRNRSPGGLSASAGEADNFLHVPVGHSCFPIAEVMPTPREWAQGTANIVWWREHTFGGHFPAVVECPVLVDDVRDFFELHA